MRMITNLFSIFDPIRGRFVRNWFSLLWVFLFLATSYYTQSPPLLRAISSLKRGLGGELIISLPPQVKHSILLILAFFSLILTRNVIGLLRFNFTPSSHIVFSLRLALPVWLGFTSFRWVKRTAAALAHLVPRGTPPALIPFMVVIETVRRVIRPLTLAIRLAANIVAGHLLLALLGGYASIFSSGITLVVLGRGVLLLTLEVAVAFIQAYVFVVLLTLYLGEV